MYSVILLATLTGGTDITGLHLKKSYPVNASGGYVYRNGVYGGGYGASFNYGPYYETGFGYSYSGTCYGTYYGPYLKDPIYSKPIGPIPRTPPMIPVEEVLPAPKVEENKQSSTQNNARIFVEIPENATLFIDGKVTKVEGDFRTFITPDLEPNKTYSYQLQVEFERNGVKIVELKKIILKSGDRISVSFVNTEKKEATVNLK